MDTINIIKKPDTCHQRQQIQPYTLLSSSLCAVAGLPRQTFLCLGTRLLTWNRIKKSNTKISKFLKMGFLFWDCSDVLFDQKSPVHTILTPGWWHRTTDIASYRLNRPGGRFSTWIILIPTLSYFDKLPKKTVIDTMLQVRFFFQLDVHSTSDNSDARLELHSILRAGHLLCSEECHEAGAKYYNHRFIPKVTRFWNSVDDILPYSSIAKLLW